MKWNCLHFSQVDKKIYIFTGMSFFFFCTFVFLTSFESFKVEFDVDIKCFNKSDSENVLIRSGINKYRQRLLIMKAHHVRFVLNDLDHTAFIEKRI